MGNDIETAKKLVSEHHYQKAYSILKALTPAGEKQQKDYYMLLGVASFELQIYDEALGAFSSLLPLYREEESVEQLLGKSNTLYEISLTYFGMYSKTQEVFQLNKAIEHCEKAVDMCLGKIFVTRKTGLMIYNRESIEPYSRYFIQLSVLYQHSGQAKKSIELLNAIKSYYIHNCETESLGVIYDELGNSYRMLDNPQIALGYYTKALMIKTRLGLEHSAEYSYRNIAVCLAQNPGIMDKKMDRIMKIYSGEYI
jgi:tetratricopeptide (TPR) repeat protein